MVQLECSAYCNYYGLTQSQQQSRLYLAKRSVVRMLWFVVILYIIIGIVGWFLRAEGDFITKRIYNAIYRLKIAKNLKVAPKVLTPKWLNEMPKSIRRAALPACVLTCEDIKVSRPGNLGGPNRIGKALSTRFLTSGDITFDTCAGHLVFNRGYVFEGYTVEKLLQAFNSVRIKEDTRKLLRKYSGYTILEFSLVYDEAGLRENNPVDNLLKLQIRVVPCTANSKGKLIMNI